MPGTILVSVLEFMNLPLSSSTSIRASMGKVEYQISDKGNFSFPLTSLRDDLIFKIQDAEGTEISTAGVHIRLILEKGVWEDIFPIGEGHLHLKFQVILSDEERDRIRMLRQSALKKKHAELVSSSGRDAESDNRSATIGNAALHFHTSDEVSELRKTHIQHEEVSRLQSPASSSDDKETWTRNVVEDQLEQQQLNPKIADQYKETPKTKLVSQAANLTQSQLMGKKPANQLLLEKLPQRVAASEEMGISLGSEKINLLTNNRIKHNLDDDDLQYSEKKPLGRSPSNVRKMISAFEGGVAQDMRSHIKPPPTKYQANIIEKKVPSEIPRLEQDKSWNTKSSGFSEERVKISSLVMVRSSDQEEEKNNNVAYNRDQEEEKNYNDLMRTSTFEPVTVSGKIPLDHSDRNPPKNEEKIMSNASEASNKLCIQRDSPQKLDPVVHFDNKYYSYESSGVWIFPDEFRNICVTTSGKSVMDIVGSQNTKCLSHQRSLDFSNIVNVQKHEVIVGAGSEESKYEKLQEIEVSKTNTSDDNGDENSGGPFNQVIKVAIIIGFGLLVLLTRQRKKRYEERRRRVPDN